MYNMFSGLTVASEIGSYFRPDSRESEIWCFFDRRARVLMRIILGQETEYFGEKVVGELARVNGEVDGFLKFCEYEGHWGEFWRPGIDFLTIKAYLCGIFGRCSLFSAAVSSKNSFCSLHH